MNRVVRGIYPKLLILLSLLPLGLAAQESLTQTVRGRVIDAHTDEPLAGAAILVASAADMQTSSDAEGHFLLKEVPVGRIGLRVEYIGYTPWVQQNLMLVSAKELYLEIRMDPAFSAMKEVVVEHTYRKDKPINEFALASARSFSVAEAERYAGSLGDPSRMAANYAGVVGVDDSRNDIIIRGNSPAGVLWRIEGLDVPSPNHYSSDGLAGGPVAMISNNQLAQSDFYTGAMPASYGNALAGAFDLRLRNGNNARYEFTGQIGFGGVELAAEGPFSKRHSASFLVGYRYSTLALFNLLGMPVSLDIGVPKYQDLGFKINVPLRRRGRVEFFGVGGLSSIDLLWRADKPADRQSTLGANIYNRCRTGILGVKYTQPLTEAFRITAGLGLTGVGTGNEVDSVPRSAEQAPYRFFTGQAERYGARGSVSLRGRWGARHTVEMGVASQLTLFRYEDEVHYRGRTFHNVQQRGRYFSSQAYGMWLYRPIEPVSINAGVHAFVLHLNGSWAVEPRLGVAYQVAGGQRINLTGGLHSQMQWPQIYFLRDRDTGRETLRDLDLNRAAHVVLGYDVLFTSTLRLKLEGYYQWLYDVPVSTAIDRSFSLANIGDSYYSGIPPDLQNRGVGRNYGLDVTFEQFLDRGYYFLVTGSLFDSQYRAADGAWRNTRFNAQFAFNLLGGYEYAFTDAHRVLVDAQGTLAGGRWYTPVDVKRSAEENTTVYDQGQTNTLKSSPYFKMNLRIGYRWNHRLFTQEWAVELQNVTNQRNLYMQVWDAHARRVITYYHSGFMPLMTYRIQF